MLCLNKGLVKYSNNDLAKKLIEEANTNLQHKKVNEAFNLLAEAYSVDPNTNGLQSCFESCLVLKINITSSKDPEKSIEDRFGLASLLIDQERYEEASFELGEIMRILSSRGDSYLLRKCEAMMFRTCASLCKWDATDKLQKRVHQSLFHPFEALKFPFISLENATNIAKLFSNKSKEGIIRNSIKNSPPNTSKVLKVGYLSPDFSGKHPLGFLMQNVFLHHNSSRVKVYLYSLTQNDGSSEVKKMRDSCDEWITLCPGMSAEEIANLIKEDELDVMVDLCGYAGTMLVSQVIAIRVAPIQISYMGFPGSGGDDLHDYLVCDKIVVPKTYRKHYTEKLIYMPHSYFVNSHRCIKISEKEISKKLYGLPSQGFVFCCHNRPDKIDPITFQTWISALKEVRRLGALNQNPQQANAVLWLLRSGPQMEAYLRSLFDFENISKETLVFCDVVPRNEHLRRIALADVFCDTPSYNAHTLGCDALWAGVPMISLPQEKMASRVGSSLLTAANLSCLICNTQKEYKTLMIQCATNPQWFHHIKKKLQSDRFSCPLFDTQRWVRNFESGILLAYNSSIKKDISVVDEFNQN